MKVKKIIFINEVTDKTSVTLYPVPLLLIVAALISPLTTSISTVALVPTPEEVEAYSKGVKINCITLNISKSEITFNTEISLNLEKPNLKSG